MSEQGNDVSALELQGFINTSGTEIAAQELCRIPGLTISVLTEMVSFGVVEPRSGGISEEWTFTEFDAQRCMRALRLLHDLELNLAGVALVLELIDELQATRARLRSLERDREV